MDILPPKPQQPAPTPAEPKSNDDEGTKINVNVSTSEVNSQNSEPAQNMNIPVADNMMDEPTANLAESSAEDVNAPEPTTTSAEDITATPSLGSSDVQEVSTAVPQDLGTADSQPANPVPSTPGYQSSTIDSSKTQSDQTPQDGSQMQNPQVIDTGKYHVPIEQDHKHGASMHILLFAVVFVLVLVVGGLVAVDAGLIDLGFDAPFNLIK